MEEHILIVEDDPFLKEFYEFIFKKMKTRITMIEDGSEFFDILEKENISVILMDVNLKNTTYEGKKIDGVFLSRKVKEDPRFKDIPILIVSAYSLEKGSRNLFEDSLADGYFTKPITDINYFLKQIQKFSRVSCQKIES
ncbi:MAG: response regulator [Melioribacteraceae bacterium]|nr:response regulator [Melioribacteraceae bacterium]